MENKKLDGMSFDELGRLFPVILTDYNPEWPALYEAEKKGIIDAAGAGNICSVHHIGSTSVEGLKAKPTIDILVELNDGADPELFKNALLDAGYEFSRQENKPPPHMMFMKGYTAEGFKGQAYHLHVRFKGDWDELVFKGYLKNNAEARRAYADLKTGLQKKYEFDREGYTQAKSGFIKAAVSLARGKL